MDLAFSSGSYLLPPVRNSSQTKFRSRLDLPLQTRLLPPLISTNPSKPPEPPDPPDLPRPPLKSVTSFLNFFINLSLQSTVTESLRQMTSPHPPRSNPGEPNFFDNHLSLNRRSSPRANLPRYGNLRTSVSSVVDYNPTDDTNKDNSLATTLSRNLRKTPWISSIANSEIDSTKTDYTSQLQVSDPLKTFSVNENEPLSSALEAFRAQSMLQQSSLCEELKLILCTTLVMFLANVNYVNLLLVVLLFNQCKTFETMFSQLVIVSRI